MTSAAPDSALIDRALRMARRLTGMDASYLSEFVGDEGIIRAVNGDVEPFGVAVGVAADLRGTYCQRVIDGRLDSVVTDTEANPLTRELAGTTRAGIRSYVGVPVRFSDGRLYGALCCIAADTRPDLGDHDEEVLSELSALIGYDLQQHSRIDRVEDEREALLDSVTHELRTPLMALRFLGEDLMSGSADARTAGRQVLQESSRVVRMVEDLMLVARQRAGTAFLQAREADLVALAAEAIDTARSFSDESADRLAAELPAEPLLATVDGDRIIRALLNLLDNGRKYSPEGGPVRLGLRQEGATAVFAVRDEGMGVHPEDVPRLGKRFFRSERAIAAGIVGTGLGLSLVQAVADLHDGLLEVDSTLGAGSTFVLRIPLRPAGGHD